MRLIGSRYKLLYEGRRGARRGVETKTGTTSLRGQGLWVTYDHGLRDGGGAAGESWWRQGGADITGEDACRDLEWK